MKHLIIFVRPHVVVNLNKVLDVLLKKYVLLPLPLIFDSIYTYTDTFFNLVYASSLRKRMNEQRLETETVFFLFTTVKGVVLLGQD